MIEAFPLIPGPEPFMIHMIDREENVDPGQQTMHIINRNSQCDKFHIDRTTFESSIETMPKSDNHIGVRMRQACARVEHKTKRGLANHFILCHDCIIVFYKGSDVDSPAWRNVDRSLVATNNWLAYFARVEVVTHDQPPELLDELKSIATQTFYI